MGQRIEVTCYAGYKADERPSTFTLEGKTLVGIVSALDIARIVSEKGLSGKTGIAPELPTTEKQSPWLTK